MDRNGSRGQLDCERGLSPSRASTHSHSTAVSESESFLGSDHHNSAYSDLRRRGSVSQRLAAFTDIGGPNSIRSFTRSWQRAAAFPEVLPHRQAFAFASDQADHATQPPPEIQYSRSQVDATPRGEWTSLLRQHFEAGPESYDGPSERRPSPGVSGEDFRSREHKTLGAELDTAFYPSSSAGSGGRRSSIFAVPPGLASPFAGSYSSYRSYGAVLGESDRRSSVGSWALGEEERVKDDELPPILVKEVEQDGKIVLAVEGQSTLPQTVFNSINVLVGVGLLSLPLGIKYAGWVCGMISLLLCAIVTAYTAKLLGKCMDLDPSLITFSDIAYISYGRKARIATSVLFTLELLAANVALVVLFADSMDLLFPELMASETWKTLCVLILLPFNFLPLRLLSYTSIVGIFSCFCIVTIVVIDGLVKPNFPGSLLEPAATYLFPRSWSTLPLSFGLLLSPWGGHSVFPNIYRDMRHPYKYGKALKITYVFTFLLDAATAAAGTLMFGDDVREAITSNILGTSGYPATLTVFMCAFVAAIPFTKIPINARPIVNTVELVCGLHGHQHHHAEHSEVYRTFVRVFARIFTLATILAIAIAFPAFDSIMAFMGSALCFSICVILPLAFYLRLFRTEISTQERLLAYFLIVVSSILSITGTIWAFLPKSLIGAD
ncbi:related to amino acid transport protein [Cephalotrichum gorgonifer]|uniref:Related to amino acid transport protein n=1 Tax=Cephalotrichum gorgonifer TaxID=2041049 RepID=A0AAE8MR12_9PEZI|nr:related to amino acid transport protein [Cephalotrichum gorgonifer]